MRHIGFTLRQLTLIVINQQLKEFSIKPVNRVFCHFRSIVAGQPAEQFGHQQEQV